MYTIVCVPPPVSDAYGWLVVSQLPLSAVIHTNEINLVSLARQNFTANTFDLINVDGSGCSTLRGIDISFRNSHHLQLPLGHRSPPTSDSPETFMSSVPPWVLGFDLVGQYVDHIETFLRLVNGVDVLMLDTNTLLPPYIIDYTVLNMGRDVEISKVHIKFVCLDQYHNYIYLEIIIINKTSFKGFLHSFFNIFSFSI